jgi:hypothetical protein
VPKLKKKNRGLSNNNLIMHLKLREKQEQTKPNTNRCREIVTIKAKIKEIEKDKLYK